MVKLSDQFVRKIEEEMEEKASPEHGSSRKLLKTGGRLCVTLRPDWCRQWGMGTGSKVLLFVDERDRLVVTPATELWSKEMEKYYDNIIERKIVEVGNSLAVAVPKDLLKDELGWEKRKLLRSSEYATVYEPYEVGQGEEVGTGLTKKAEEGEKKAEAEGEREGIKRSVKVVAVAAAVMTLIMTGFIMKSSPSESVSWELSSSEDWASGSFKNTTTAGGAVQLAPAFLEDCENGWGFNPSENRLSAQGWRKWFTQGEGSVAIGDVRTNSTDIGAGEEIVATKDLDLSGIDQLVLDIYSSPSFPEIGEMIREIEIGNETILSTKGGKKISKDGYEVDGSNFGSNTTVTLRIKNNSVHNWPSPLTAVDAIRSKELKSKSGTYSTDWHDMGESVNCENLETKASIPSNSSIDLTFQVSNTGEGVSNEREIEGVEDGTTSYDISNLKGRYVRVKTTFQSGDFTSTPKLYYWKAC